jgi:hypothetical protein
MSIDDFFLNPDALQSIYGHTPKVDDHVRIRSVNLSWRGPTLIIRIDLPYFPDPAPQEWVASEFDTVQCHLGFLAVQNLAIHSWKPPAFGRLEATPRAGERCLHIDINGDGVNLEFDCADSVMVGHVSGFKIDTDGSDQGSRSFASRIDSRRYASLPETWEKSYYERT